MNDAAMIRQLTCLEAATGGKEKLCKAIGISLSTLYRRKQEPWTLNLGEIRRITKVAKQLNMPFEVSI